MENILSKIIETALGPIRLSAIAKGLTEVEFIGNSPASHDIPAEADIQGKEAAAVLKQAEIQLKEYFEGRRKDFDLPLAARGTEFQMRVWKELQKIPYGETRTYGEIAEAIGRPKAARAIGGANNRNPLSIIVPCHRVVGKNGDLVGYASGLDLKEKLLKLEKTGNL